MGVNGNPLQDSCLKNPMDRGAWQATIHRVSESQTRLKRLSTSITDDHKLSTLNNTNSFSYPCVGPEIQKPGVSGAQLAPLPGFSKAEAMLPVSLHWQASEKLSGASENESAPTFMQVES